MTSPTYQIGRQRSVPGNRLEDYGIGSRSRACRRLAPFDLVIRYGVVAREEATHYGLGDWYLDKVLQGTFYNGNATTAFAGLATNGAGIVASLEAGYPVPLPVFGPGFVLEPQAQILWQHAAFDQANDGLGAVALGADRPARAMDDRRCQRLGVAALVRANLWQDWDASATTTFDGMPVPLRERATRLDLAAGLTARLTRNLSLYAQGGYQFAVVYTDDVRRDGVKGDLGLRYTW